MPLLDARGNPITSDFKQKKPVVTLPKTGDIFGQWAGRDFFQAQLPGGMVMQFDLSRLTLADYRSMRQNYQINASISVLAFVMHQINWHIECSDSKINDFLTQQITDNWTTLIRAMAQSYWAGFAPCALNFNNGPSGYIEISSIKDMIPEECRVNWKKSYGWAPPGHVQPTIWSYDGFFQGGCLIPPENSLWYPLLMENGNYYGRKLLQPAFPAFYFSNLMHLYTNRYFERFGEPLPIGRADFDQEVDIGNNTMVSGKTAMETIVNNIRSRAVTVLPSTRDPNTKEFDFSVDYLESQMRGADWERYLARLDEEMALAVFTPSLLFRTASVGSYNLGDLHYQIFQQELNALAGDIQYYMNNFLIDRLRVINFGQNSPTAKWTFRQQGQPNLTQYKEVLSMLIRQQLAMPDLKQLGQIVGLDLQHIEQIIVPPDPAGTGELEGLPGAIPPGPLAKPQPKVKIAASIMREAGVRLGGEISKGRKDIPLGFKNRFRDALVEDGFDADKALQITNELYSRLNPWIADAIPVIEDAEQMKSMFAKVVDFELAAL